MAGCPLHLHTDSTTVAKIASGFFPPTGLPKARQARADLTLLVGNRRDISSAPCGFPIFRGRNQYVHADYGSDGSVWFDLKARAVSGIVSERLVEDDELFRRNVLAVIAGVLAPALDRPDWFARRMCGARRQSGAAGCKFRRGQINPHVGSRAARVELAIGRLDVFGW